MYCSSSYVVFSIDSSRSYIYCKIDTLTANVVYNTSTNVDIWHSSYYRMSRQVTRYAPKLFSCYPIKENLMRMLRPYDLARFVTYENLHLSEYEKKKYLNYIFDIVDYPFWEKDEYKYEVILYGIDSSLLLFRLSNPLEYEKKYSYDHILKIGISVRQKVDCIGPYMIPPPSERSATLILRDTFAFPSEFFIMGDNDASHGWDTRNNRWIISETANESKVLVIVSIYDYFNKNIVVPVCCRNIYMQFDIGIVDISRKAYSTNYIKVSSNDQSVKDVESLDHRLWGFQDQEYLRLTVRDYKGYEVIRM